MKKFIFYLFFAFASVATFGQVVEVEANVDSLAAEIGDVKKVVMVSPDTAIVTNTDEQQFTLVGENVGQLVSTLLTGFAEIKENVSETEGRPLDWIMEIAKWLLGGAFTSILAFGSRSIKGIKSLFSGIAKNKRLVTGIAGALAIAWLLIQGGDFKTLEFWMSWGVMWFAFTMFAMGLYDTVFSKIFKTPKTEDEQLKAVADAQLLVQASGGVIRFPTSQ